MNRTRRLLDVNPDGKRHVAEPPKITLADLADPNRAYGLADEQARDIYSLHDRIASSSRVRNAAIGRFITMRPAARHPGQGFREAQALTQARLSP
jgi:hypothetical protein